ncbi:aldo/keto reductase [Streptomonospora algeriensis]|uniref:Aldo/keto reductase n=1 Tax=Streptomonospora algeriensis TaxID=995084 RepID=A0ABW3BHL5_9ACTN
MSQSTARPAAAAGTFDIGGEFTVNRLGYGAMQLTGPGIWGEPSDPAEAVRVLRRAAELGVTLIDTADAYGPFVSEDLIAQALRPYPEDLVIATKGGLTRQGPGLWLPVGRPEYLRQCVEMSLRRLGVERIGLYQLHRVDPQVPLEDQVGVLDEMRREGKIAHIGLSEVSVAQIEAAQAVTGIATVQNLYNLTDRASQDVLDYCERHGLGFIPWFPLATGELARPGGVLAEAANEHGSSPARLALAWLLHRSPVALPIPGTSSTGHLEENLAAAQISLSDEEVDRLTALA